MGTGIAFLLLDLMGGLLVGRYGQEPLTLAASAGLLLAMSVTAILWPIGRAMAASPVAALRYE
jgi:hypothetical protein